MRLLIKHILSWSLSFLTICIIMTLYGWGVNYPDIYVAWLHYIRLYWYILLLPLVSFDLLYYVIIDEIFDRYVNTKN